MPPEGTYIHIDQPWRYPMCVGPFLLAATLLGQTCITTEVTRMPASGAIVEVLQVNGNGLTPSATVICIQGAGSCQTIGGQALLPAVLQGAAGNALTAAAIAKSANGNTAAPAVVNTNTRVNVRTGNVTATASGGRALNLVNNRNQ